MIGSAGVGSGGKLLFHTELPGKASPPDGDGWAETWKSKHDPLLGEQQALRKNSKQCYNRRTPGAGAEQPKGRQVELRSERGKGSHPTTWLHRPC